MSCIFCRLVLLMVYALTQALSYLVTPFQRQIIWRAFYYTLIVRPVGRLLQLWRDARVLTVEMWRMQRRQKWQWGIGLTLAAAGCLGLIGPHDQPWLRIIQSEPGTGKHTLIFDVARTFSYWGDFLGFNLITALALFATSLLLRSRFLRMVVVASILGATLTGACANLGRVLLGRARPSATEAPSFYGPSLLSRRHSCPSGHTATAFGGSIPVAVALPPVGVPMLIVAGGIAWSRMYTNAHHPTDILASIILATIFGVPLGLLTRRMRRFQHYRLRCYAALEARSRRRSVSVSVSVGAIPPVVPSSCAPHSVP